MIKRPWLIFALTTTLFWGAWGALIETPEKAGFPATLGYIVWSLTMIPCALVALGIIKWKLEVDKKSIFYGLLIGLTGAGGQLVLFHALVEGPAYLVFPIISLSPSVTVILSLLFLKETTTRKHWAGIIIAMVAIALMSYQEPQNTNDWGKLWFVLAFLVFLAWGIQAFFMKIANNRMKTELLLSLCIGLAGCSTNATKIKSLNILLKLVDDMAGMVSVFTVTNSGKPLILISWQRTG